MASTSNVVATTGINRFGGQRIPQGVSAANLWDDGVVLASAWSEDDTLDGAIFTFRGTIRRATYSRTLWAMRTEDDLFVDDFKTRKAAVAHAERMAQRAAFRGLNEKVKARTTTLGIKVSLPDGSVLNPAPRHTVGGKTSDNGWPYGTTHDMDCPGCEGTSFTSSPRSETYWAS
jgi:hypothetical protein